MIEFKDVHASYNPEIPILRGVSFTIRDGEFVSFVGTNGTGKSTTMRLINGLLKPESGEVLVDGRPTTSLKTSALARSVGFLFQNPDRQICCGTVREELLFGFRAQGRLDAEAEARAESIAEELGLDLSADPFLLNRGARQLLALASVVVLEPPTLILDEPTTGLDHRECMKVMGIVRRLNREKGVTVVMVSHDMEVVADFSDRVIVMAEGRVVDEGATFEVLRRPRTLAAASLVPPQIAALSMELVEARPALAGTPVARANDLSAMTEALSQLIEKKGAD